MTVHTEIKAAAPFNPLGAYEREREHARKIEAQLLRATLLLRMACDADRVINKPAVRAFLEEVGQ